MYFNHPENKTIVIFDDSEFSFKISAYNEVLELGKKVIRFSFVSMIETEEDYLQTLYSYFKNHHITKLELKDLENNSLRVINETFNFVNADVGFYVTPDGGNRIQGNLILEYTLGA